MAGGCFESGEAGAEGNVEERSRRKRVQVVMCRDEEIGKIGPARGRVEGLGYLNVNTVSLLVQRHFSLK